MPFTTIYLITGRPVSIPRDTPRSELTQYVAAAQQAMDEINEEAERLAGRNSRNRRFLREGGLSHEGHPRLLSSQSEQSFPLVNESIHGPDN